MTARSIWNPAVETLDRGARERLQTERLAATVEWARSRVPFYRARLAAPVEKLDDLRSLPFTHKSDLRDHYPFGLFAVPLGEGVRIHASSGTKGKPTVVGYTAVDLEVWREASTAAARSRGSRCTSRRRRRSSSGAAASTPSIPRCAASWPGAPPAGDRPDRRADAGPAAHHSALGGQGGPGRREAR